MMFLRLQSEQSQWRRVVRSVSTSNSMRVASRESIRELTISPSRGFLFEENRTPALMLRHHLKRERRRAGESTLKNASVSLRGGENDPQAAQPTWPTGQSYRPHAGEFAYGVYRTWPQSRATRRHNADSIRLWSSPKSRSHPSFDGAYIDAAWMRARPRLSYKQRNSRALASIGPKSYASGTALLLSSRGA